jgi:hypothetical protein
VPPFEVSVKPGPAQATFLTPLPAGLASSVSIPDQVQPRLWSANPLLQTAVDD